MSFAVYLRVSTDKQSTENQEPEVKQVLVAREFSGEDRSWETGLVFRETGSAAKHRPVFEEMMEAGRRGRFRRLYIWSLDRFGRSMFGNLADLRSLASWGVQVVSVREPWVEKTADPLFRDLLLAIFSWVAQHERERLIQRTRAGLDRARAKGVKLGRKRVVIPERALAKSAELRTRYGASMSWRRLAAELERLGLGTWSHATLAQQCRERVPESARGRPGFRGRR